MLKGIVYSDSLGLPVHGTFENFWGILSLSVKMSYF